MGRQRFGSVLEIRGRYVARYRMGGRAHQRTFPSSRQGKRDANLWLAQQEAAIYGVKSASPGETFGSFLRKFRADYRIRLRPSTWVNVKHHLEMADEHFRGRPIASIGRKDARAFLRAMMEERGVGAATVRRYAASLSSVFQAAQDEGVVDANPFLRLKLPKPDQPPREWLTVERVVEVLQKTPPEVHAFASLIAETGLRLSEAGGLLWTDMKGDRLVVRSALAKSHKSRVVPLTKKARATVSKLSASAVHETQRPDRVFRFQADYYGRRFNAAMKRHGLAGVTVHSLRHAFASRLLESGVRIDVAQAILGHASVETTRLYVHHSREAVMGAAHLLEPSKKDAKEAASGD